VSAYFIDTSALGKHYHREPGSDLIDEIFGEPNTSRFISRLSAVEIHAVLAKKVREKHISLKDFERLRRRFLFDVHEGLLRIIRMGSTHYGLAQKLLVKHAPEKSLRTLDALQLGVAIELQDHVTLKGFVAADRALLTIAKSEGLMPINPEKAAEAPQT
jgi:predicted nucleic acid-binding protein